MSLKKDLVRVRNVTQLHNIYIIYMQIKCRRMEKVQAGSSIHKIIRLLGRGSFGSVHLARRIKDGVELVLKQVKGCQEANATEVRALATFQHPLIVRYFDSFSHEDEFIICMEYVAGGTLHDLLANSTELLDEDRVVQFLAQLVTALYQIHSRRILHRDLTTRNVLVSQDGKFIKLADFGHSKLLQTRNRTQSLVGTPEYFSPEIIQGLPYGFQSDIWSLGCLLYNMMTLHPPFQAPSIPALVVAISNSCWTSPSIKYSPELHSLLRGMLTNNPESRLRLYQIGASPSVALALVKLAGELSTQFSYT